MYSSSSLLIQKKDAFTGLCQQIKKKNSEDILGKVDKKNLSHLADFGHLEAEGFG